MAKRLRAVACACLNPGWGVETAFFKNLALVNNILVTLETLLQLFRERERERYLLVPSICVPFIKVES